MQYIYIYNIGMTCSRPGTTTPSVSVASPVARQLELRAFQFARIVITCRVAVPPDCQV